MPKENIHTNQDRYKKQIVVSFSGGRTSAFMAHIGELEGDELLTAAMRLLGKIRIIHGSKKYKAVWESAQIQLGAYNGLDYVDEMTELSEAVRKALLAKSCNGYGCGECDECREEAEKEEIQMISPNGTSTAFTE